MQFVTALAFCLTVFHYVHGDTINHDQVQPFAQPDPVTISEKAAIKFKPQLKVQYGCASFPAVNAAGEITGGLKGTKGTSACSEAPLGSQVYGRSAWYQDKWAMMFAWYFPKNFWDGGPRSRHNWASMVLWIDNPAIETPKLLGASFSHQVHKNIRGVEYEKEPYRKQTTIPPESFIDGSNVSTRVAHTFVDQVGWIGLEFTDLEGEYQDLIMWNQLTDQARFALESADFGDVQVPFTNKNFETALKQAFPL